MKKLEFTYAGITYLAEVDTEDGYVTAVFSVAVDDGKEHHAIKMDRKQRKAFFKCFEDELNEAYRQYQIALAQSLAEENWESKNGR